MQKRFVLLASAIFFASGLGFAQTLTNYEYWIDEDYTGRTSQSNTNEAIEIAADISTLSSGVHFFNFRAEDSNGEHSPFYRYLFYVPELLPEASPLATCEYWLDDDYANRIESTANNSNTFAVDISSLSSGVHFYNFMGKTAGGDRSALYRYLFYVPEILPEASLLATCEYWLDDDYANRTEAAATNSNTFAVDISSLSSGVHFYNFMGKTAGGDRSALYRYLFYVPEILPEASPLATCEYWLDDDYANRTEAAATNSNTFAVDISSLSSGVHFYNFMGKTARGDRSALYRYLFYVPEILPEASPLTTCEYWLDEDYANRVETTAGGFNSFAIDISAVPSGVHFYNFMGKTARGDRSALYRYLFYVPYINDLNTDLESYTYSFNGVQTVVPISGTSFEMANYAIPLPDILDVARIDSNCDFTILTESDSVQLRRSTEVNFALQFRNVSGEVSIPEMTSYTEADSIFKKAHVLELQKTVKFDKVKRGDFEAVVFDIPESGTYYIRSLEACTLDLYNGSGTKITTISQSALYNTYSMALSAGKYYGVAYDMVRDTTFTDTQMGLRLMLTADYVPTPEISFADGVVTITCVQEDVRIYYTLDGTEPSRESTLYEAPFELLHNAVIKAVAVCDDLADSYVATCNVNSYKVETPEIQFANLLVYISCPTADSHIYYTVDGTDPDSNGMLYDAPFGISGNCTIKAIAKRNGYNSSDIAELIIDVSNVKCITPVISVENSMMYITTLTEGATIHYTDDGTVPTSASTVYTDPILLTHNGTYKAIAVKEGELQSDVCTYDVDWFQVPKPSIGFDNGIVTITSTLEGAQIYYTLDGSEPTTESTLYTEPFAVSGNGMVKAFAICTGFIDSEVTVYEIGSYKVATPEAMFSRMHLYLSCSTPGAEIWFTLDNTDPESNGTLYTEPIELEQGCVVRAVGKLEGYNNSDELYYELNFSLITCAMPSFSRDENQITIECETPETTIYYTTDGTDPTEESAVYSTPITVEHNQIIKAFAVRDHWIDSEISDYTVDWFTVETPVIELNDSTLTISCSTPGSVIYYAIGGADPTRESYVYSAPLRIIDNQPIKAFAIKNDFNDSGVAEFIPTSFTCVMPEIAYDGHAIILTTPTDNAEIYYTLDGSNPDVSSWKYDGEVILDGLCVVKAITVKAHVNASEIMSYSLPSYYNGGKVYVAEPGNLFKAFEWTDGTAPYKTEITGTLNDDDFAYLRTCQNIGHLDIRTVEVNANRLPDGALQGMNIISVSMPENASIVPGNRMLAGCNQLAAVIWNKHGNVPDDILGDMTLPNMLLYVKSVGYASTKFGNVVSNGVASSITLYDNVRSNFYCPESFSARTISYTHNYAQQTEPGVCRGWETIALPFAPTVIEHETNGEAVPFGSDATGKKMFWLRQLTESGFVRATEIKANTPYIISMPDNDIYVDEYILSGNVTFSASNATVEASESAVVREKDGFCLTPAFQYGYSEAYYAINVSEEYNGYAEGSVFVSGLREVHPFEAYLVNDSQNASVMRGDIFEIEPEDIETAIEMLHCNMSVIDNRFIYNLNGLRIDLDRNQLPDGIYIIEGKTVYVKH